MKKRSARFMSGKRIQTQRRRLGMFLIEQWMGDGDRDWEKSVRYFGRICDGDGPLDSGVQEVRADA